jgi:acetyl esterase/lipase
VLAVAHGSTGTDPSCAPSLSMRPFAATPGVEEALAAGWVVVATDYPGLGTPGPHPYLVGASSAHAVVDSIRAAAALAGADPSRAAIWGYSQGGHAALFAIDEAGRAADVDLVGAVLFAPATDLAGLIDAGQGSVAGTLLLVTTAVSWSEVYPDLALDDVVAADALDDAREIAARCLDPTSLPMSVVRSIGLRDALARLDDPQAARWAAAVDRNTPTAPVQVPVLVLHGDDDLLISSEVTVEHVADRCARGEPIEMRIVPGAGHITLLARTVDDALAWTVERLHGRPLDIDCPPGPDGLPDRPDSEPEPQPVGPLGAVPRPDWLGTRPLPIAPSGFGEVRETPPELRDRRLVTVSTLPPPPGEGFHASVRPVRAEVLARSSWHEGCPVDASELRHLTVTFRGFDGGDHTGELLIHADEAVGVVEVFRALHAAAFPIEEMRIVRADELDAPPTGDGNNTTGFVCRSAVSGASWSEHAFGRAIDVNPFHNPYVRATRAAPPTGQVSLTISAVTMPNMPFVPFGVGEDVAVERPHARDRSPARARCSARPARR